MNSAIIFDSIFLDWALEVGLLYLHELLILITAAPHSGVLIVQCRKLHALQDLLLVSAI